jgi:hypothetical protein
MKCATSVMTSPLILAVWLVACSSPEPSLPDSEVWRAVVSYLCRPDFSVGVVVHETTASVPEQGSSGLKGKDELWEALRARNSKSDAIAADLGGCDGIRVVPERILEQAFAESDAVPPKWDGFYARFPNAHSIFRLSRPGYTLDRSSALVLGSITSCDGFCGSGNYYELHKQDSRWVVTGVITAWIS